MVKRRANSTPADAAPTAKARSWLYWFIPLVFAGVGVIMSGWIVLDLWTWTAMKNWVPTPATLLEVDLESQHGHKGRTTYKATAHYRYEFGGRLYEGKRVAIYGGSDNFGGYQHRRAAELRQLLNARMPAVCFVDPESPSDAVLFRDLRTGFLAFKLLIGVVFGAVGGALFVGAVRERRESTRNTRATEPPSGDASSADADDRDDRESHRIKLESELPDDLR